MLEDTIKELCRKTGIEREGLELNESTFVNQSNETFTLQHYKTEELEAVSIKCKGRGYLEIDISTGHEDRIYQMEIKVSSCYVGNLRKLIAGMKQEGDIYERVKNKIFGKVSFCDDPASSEAIIPFEEPEQQKAAEFAYELFCFRNTKTKKKK